MALVFTAITPLGWSVIGLSVIVGVAGGNFIYKRFPNIFNLDRKMKKIINNPHLLVEKLKSQGEVYDNLEDGRRVEIDIRVDIDNKSGKEVLVFEKKEPVKKLKEIKDKNKPKKKVKKKKVKKK